MRSEREGSVEKGPDGVGQKLGVGPQCGEAGSRSSGEPRSANAPELAKEGLSGGRASPGMSSTRTEKRLGTQSHCVLTESQLRGGLWEGEDSYESKGWKATRGLTSGMAASRGSDDVIGTLSISWLSFPVLASLSGRLRPQCSQLATGTAHPHPTSCHQGAPV